MEEDLSKATWIHACVATPDLDSQGERLKIEGADISRMVTHGVFNSDHQQGLHNALGKIMEAKKIFKKDDCTNEHHHSFWNKMKRPFIYAKGFLFDDAGHPAAKAVSAIIKEFKTQNVPYTVKASVEGKTLRRNPLDKSVIEGSMIQNVALTLTPANKNTEVLILDDPAYQNLMAKCAGMGDSVRAEAEALIKNMGVHHQQTLGGDGYADIIVVAPKFSDRIAKAEDFLNKALTAGYDAGTSSPAGNTGGAALMVESVDKKVKRQVPERIKKMAIDALATEIYKRSRGSNIDRDRLLSIASDLVNRVTEGDL